MDFTYTEEQEMLRKSAREFLTQECPEKFVRAMESDAKGYSPELWKKIADLGWHGLMVPEKYGGSQGSIMDMCALFEEVGRAMLPGPLFSTAVLGVLTVLAAGSESQKSEYLPRIIKGDCIMSLALTEPESSWDGKAWDPDGVRMRARKTGDGYILNGTKLFIHDANIADYLLVVARTRQTQNPANGITIFIVDAKDPGITCNLLETTAGDNQCEVIFNNVRVPGKDILGPVNRGWRTITTVMNQGTVILCAQMLGGAQKLLDASVEYAQNRIQFDLPIGVNQYVQEHCVNLYSDMDGIKLTTYYAAWKLSKGEPAELECSIAKAWSSDAYERICWYAHQVFAGVGFTTQEGIVPLYSRRAKTLQLYLGDTAYHKEKIVRLLEKWPKPEMPQGTPLGLWKNDKELLYPEWLNEWMGNTKEPLT